MEDYIVRRYSWPNVLLQAKKISKGVGFWCLSVAACRSGPARFWDELSENGQSSSSGRRGMEPVML